MDAHEEMDDLLNNLDALLAIRAELDQCEHAALLRITDGLMDQIKYLALSGTSIEYKIKILQQ